MCENGKRQKKEKWLPMLTSFTPSASMAWSAVDTFSRWWCWLAGLGFHLGKRRCVNTSTSAHKRVPSRKSSAKSTTGPPPISPACFKCSFTQFLNVFACISTQRSSWPFIGIPFAAVPSADLATRPTNCSGRSCSVDCILISIFTNFFLNYFYSFFWYQFLTFYHYFYHSFCSLLVTTNDLVQNCNY